ncbi:hypothetical protein CBG25_01990 [Arsenophonus sp. ENCA]|uniref:hypothetical protein n=1 Tax=Arsenophonus sp. ENCA TaxID=1987579 RepID=UPI000BD185E1|nr:hypothetical protein [Arsenophonus sp. ENCA]PAV10417.1 hypothetical protein CBG25_01990 [Arsenophonus sp. ENCA]
MEYSNTIKITCKPEHLESYFYQKMASEGGNNGFAKSLGIHPSTASRDKTRIFKLACQVVSEYGLPRHVISVPDSASQEVVITNISGEEIRKLIDMLEHLRLPKKEAPELKNNEALECQIECCI